MEEETAPSLSRIWRKCTLPKNEVDMFCMGLVGATHNNSPVGSKDLKEYPHTHTKKRKPNSILKMDIYSDKKGPKLGSKIRSFNQAINLPRDILSFDIKIFLKSKSIKDRL